MRLGKPRTLRGRLALWYAGVLTVVLAAFSTTVYIVERIEDDPAHSQEGDADEKRLAIAFAIGLPAAIAAAVLGGLSISRRALRPIDEIVRITRELGARQLSTRIPLAPGAPEEVRALALALNLMLAR